MKNSLNRKKAVFVLGIILIGILLLSLHSKNFKSYQSSIQEGKIISGAFDTSKLKPDSEWKKILTPQQYYILRQQGTEVPFTGILDHETRKGTYYSAGCDVALFRSEQKYDSGTGWPSFWAPVSDNVVVLREDSSIPLESRIEVLDTCGNHLGHVFDDGPRPTGKRYCMNSAALRFVPDQK